MKKLILVISLMFLCAYAYGDNLPVFKIPSNEAYDLFNYSYSSPNAVTNEAGKKQESKTSKNLGLKIYGIFISDGEKVVLIGDKILKEGDVINGYTVKKINDNEVVLAKGNSVIVEKLTLSEYNGVLFDNNTIKSK